MKKDSIYILNPEYDIRLDKNRAIITNRSNDPSIDSFVGFVHPIYAIIISLFDGEKKLSEVIENISSLLKKDEELITNIVTPILENKEKLHFQYDNYHFSFPKRLLIRRNKKIKYKKYDPKDFFIRKDELDLESWQLYYPLDILFMVNTRCVTDCIYCYADRRRNIDCEIPMERIKELIREAKELNMRSFDITGGEIFLYAHWEELLSELIANDFTPYISTKCPIKLDTIRKIKRMGINRIQISIDSIKKKELKEILNVKEDYFYQLLETLKNLDENDIEIHTNTQLTSINIAHANELMDYLLGLKNIKRINMGAVGLSIYKGEENYLEHKPALEDIKKIESYFNEFKEKYKDKIKINFSGYTERDRIITKDLEEKKKNFKKRSRCSANFYAFVILPDGKVTICEELYWHPAFIIGDLMTQSIEEVWNSKRAIELYNISKDMIRDESPCKKCDEFDPCHKYNGVCWKEIIYAYGYENWDYADPKCPYAVEPKIKYYL